MLRHRIFFQVLIVFSSLVASLGTRSAPAFADGLAVPSYSSLPGSPHTLYLNFGGTTFPGTWGGSTPGTVPAYDIDGNPNSFSATELSNIQQIWARVAEAYSPFNVNVTTVAPGTTPVAGQWSQIIIGAEDASGSDWYGVAGGASYVGGFTDGGMEYGTGWAFTNYLDNGDPKDTAIAASHEAGHQFGLEHQRQFNSSGSLINEYRPSTDGGYTAPIMGYAYSAVRALWSDGTSASATSDQNDMAIISTTLGYRPESNIHDMAHAQPLTVAANAFSASSVIETMSQNDFYSFTTGAGNVTISVVHNPNGGMLDSKLSLYAQDGALITTIDPPLTLTGPDYGLDANFSGTLAAGTYYIDVGSHGNYGDVGTYFLSGTLEAVPEPGTLLMLATGLIGLLAYARRRK
jgi:hypothetical protein